MRWAWRTVKIAECSYHLTWLLLRLKCEKSLFNKRLCKRKRNVFFFYHVLLIKHGYAFLTLKQQNRRTSTAKHCLEHFSWRRCFPTKSTSKAFLFSRQGGTHFSANGPLGTLNVFLTCYAPSTWSYGNTRSNMSAFCNAWLALKHVIIATCSDAIWP